MLTTKSNIVNEYNVFVILCYSYKIGRNPENFKPLLMNADVFLYQLVYKNDIILSTFPENENNLMKNLKPTCIKISFSNPQNDAIFLHKHPHLSDYVKENGIKNIINSNFSILQQKIFEKTTRIFLEKDKDCDIKIFDFIITNITKKRVFIDKYHPTSFVLMELTRRIMLFLPKIYNIIDEELIDNIMNFTEAGALSAIDVSFFKMEFVTSEEMHNGNIYLQNRINDIWIDDKYKNEFDKQEEFALTVWE
jgi:hypothetical protein